MARDDIPDVDYGGASSPGESAASNLGVGPGGQGVLPGTNFGYYGPSYNFGYYGPWPSGFGEPQNTPYSAGNWYRPRLGEPPAGPAHPPHDAHHQSSGREHRHRGNADGARLNDTLAIEPGPDFAPGEFGEGGTYYGPSYNWGRGQEDDAYASFGPSRGYGPGNWYNPETSPDYGGERPPWNVGSTLNGYGQPFSGWSGYQGTQPINPSPTGSGAGDQRPGHHRGVGSRTYQRSDERIREDVSEALTDDHHVNAADVEVSVRDGVVTLSGSVPDRAQKRQAREVADSVRGVKDVRNDLQIRSSGQAA